MSPLNLFGINPTATNGSLDHMFASQVPQDNTTLPPFPCPPLHALPAVPLYRSFSHIDPWPLPPLLPHPRPPRPHGRVHTAITPKYPPTTAKISRHHTAPAVVRTSVSTTVHTFVPRHVFIYKVFMLSLLSCSIRSCVHVATHLMNISASHLSVQSHAFPHAYHLHGFPSSQPRG